jgi:class 3 adenylate cyclase
MGEVKKTKHALDTLTQLQDELQKEERKNRQMSFETEQQINEAERSIDHLENEQKVASLTRNYLLGIVGLLLIISGGIYNRFRTKKRANQLLEEKNALIVLEKAKVEKEKGLSEELLLNILPEEVAEELKQKGEAEARLFDRATVLFTDFKGFTSMSEKLTPKALVKDLNDCFSAFDLIIEKHGIEKIKTIGDAYMAAGGLPMPNKTHTADIINAALEMRNFIEEGKDEKIMQGLPYFEIRIGIHTGPVVAGIVGVKKFQYDIWGDTVNTASRMESSGDVGKVNISEATYKFVQNHIDFDFDFRGKIAAKNKGEIEMYFVERAS